MKYSVWIISADVMVLSVFTCGWLYWLLPTFQYRLSNLEKFCWQSVLFVFFFVVQIPSVSFVLLEYWCLWLCSLSRLSLDYVMRDCLVWRITVLFWWSLVDYAFIKNGIRTFQIIDVDLWVRIYFGGQLYSL